MERSESEIAKIEAELEDISEAMISIDNDWAAYVAGFVEDEKISPNKPMPTHLWSVMKAEREGARLTRARSRLQYKLSMLVIKYGLAGHEIPGHLR